MNNDYVIIIANRFEALLTNETRSNTKCLTGKSKGNADWQSELDYCKTEEEKQAMDFERNS